MCALVTGVQTCALPIFKWLRALGKQDALKDWIVEETLPGSRIETDEDILANAVQLGGTSFHICGTCRMGPDATSVVDPSLRVRGFDGLRVVDTFIMPTIVSGNTTATPLAVARNAAHILLITQTARKHSVYGKRV